MPTRLTRRSLLVSAGLGAAAALAACDSTGDSDSEVGPTDGAGRVIRSEAADVVLMFATLERTRSLLVLASGLVEEATSGVLPEIEASLAEQAAVLERLLRAAEVDPGPGPEVAPAAPSRVDETAVTTGPDDAAQTSGGGVPRGDRMEALADGLAADAGPEALAQVAAATAANLPTLLALHGQRAAAAVLLRRRLSWPELVGPDGPAAVGSLVALRQAVYALEVAAAKAGGEERTGYEEILDSVRPLTDQIQALAGSAAPTPPLGYALPDGLESRQRRSALVMDVLAAVPAAVLDGSAGLAGDVAGVTGSVRVLSVVVPHAQRLGVPLAAFPGMTVP
jgi:hypothetical protein